MSLIVASQSQVPFLALFLATVKKIPPLAPLAYLSHRIGGLHLVALQTVRKAWDCFHTSYRRLMTLQRIYAAVMMAAHR